MRLLAAAALVVLVLAAPSAAADVVIEQPLPFSGARVELRDEGAAHAHAWGPLVDGVATVSPWYAGAGGFVGVVAFGAALSCLPALPACDPVVVGAGASVLSRQASVTVYKFDPGAPVACASAPVAAECRAL